MHLLCHSSLGQRSGGLGWVLWIGSHKAKVKVAAGGAFIEAPGTVLSPSMFGLWDEHSSWLAVSPKLLYFQRPLTWPFHLSARNPTVFNLSDFLLCHQQEKTLCL